MAEIGLHPRATARPHDRDHCENKKQGGCGRVFADYSFQLLKREDARAGQRATPDQSDKPELERDTGDTTHPTDDVDTQPSGENDDDDVAGGVHTDDEDDETYDLGKDSAEDDDGDVDLDPQLDPAWGKGGEKVKIGSPFKGKVEWTYIGTDVKDLEDTALDDVFTGDKEHDHFADHIDTSVKVSVLASLLLAYPYGVQESGGRCRAPEPDRRCERNG